MMQGLACHSIKLEDVLIVDSARALVKLCNFGSPKVRFCPIRSHYLETKYCEV